MNHFSPIAEQFSSFSTSYSKSSLYALVFLSIIERRELIISTFSNFLFIKRLPSISSAASASLIPAGVINPGLQLYVTKHPVMAPNDVSGITLLLPLTVRETSAGTVHFPCLLHPAAWFFLNARLWSGSLSQFQDTHQEEMLCRLLS